MSIPEDVLQIWEIGASIISYPMCENIVSTSHFHRKEEPHIVQTSMCYCVKCVSNIIYRISMFLCEISFFHCTVSVFGIPGGPGAPGGLNP